MSVTATRLAVSNTGNDQRTVTLWSLACPRSIACSGLSNRVQRLEVCDQGRGLLRAEVLSVSRHIAAALDHLADELILREPDRDSIERRAALSIALLGRMAIAAFQRLEHPRAPALQRRPL